jgi:hypothetical protein
MQGIAKWNASANRGGAVTNMNKLLKIASQPLSMDRADLSIELCTLAGKACRQLNEMLCNRNGFYAFESALHVFPARSTQIEIGIHEWNESLLWRSDYKTLIDGCVFFAEDVFGGQFCIFEEKVCTFDPETAEVAYLADDLEGWASIVLDDYEVLTGYPLAHEWQKAEGRLCPGKRLLPKLPFVMGGEFILENLFLGSAVDGMKSRAAIANQIAHLPDGTSIKIEVSD